MEDHRRGQTVGGGGQAHPVSWLDTLLQGPVEVLGGAKLHLSDILAHLTQAREF